MGLLAKFRKSSKSSTRQSYVSLEQAYTFRRSRTFTGTPSAKINSSAEARSQLKTSRLQVHELHQERAKVMKLLFGLVVCMVVLSFLIANYITNFTITYAQQPHGQPNTAAYETTLRQYFGQQPFQRFAFMLNTQQLADFMRAKYGEFARFMVARSWYGGVRFVVSFRRPIIVWQTASGRFYVDADGFAFNYDDYGNPLVSVNDQSGISADSGSSVVSAQFLSFLGQMVGALNRGGKGQVSDVIVPASTREIDVKLQGRGYIIKTNIDRDPLQQAQDIINALTYFDAHRIVPQYIDARVQGEAFYK